METIKVKHFPWRFLNKPLLPPREVRLLHWKTGRAYLQRKGKSWQRTKKLLWGSLCWFVLFLLCIVLFKGHMNTSAIEWCRAGVSKHQGQNWPSAQFLSSPWHVVRPAHNNLLRGVKDSATMAPLLCQPRSADSGAILGRGRMEGWRNWAG